MTNDNTLIVLLILADLFIVIAYAIIAAVVGSRTVAAINDLRRYLVMSSRVTVRPGRNVPRISEQDTVEMPRLKF